MDNYWGAGRLDVYAAAAQLLSEISGSLCGTVSDSITGSPIAGAGVEMPELQIWAQTDTSGHYFLPSIPPGIYEVRFSAAGYDTLIVPEVAIALGVAETLSVALAGPHIWVEVQEIAGELTWGDSLQVPVIVHNTGSADLAVNFVKEGEWEPFELYLSLPVQTLTGDSKLFGVEIADSSFWISGGNNDLEPNHLYRFSFDGQIQAILDQPPTGSTWGWYDLAWDGQYLYGSSGDLLIGMDAEGTVRDSIAGPLALHRALAYDPATDHFFAGDNTSDIVEFDRSGAVIHSWPHDLHVQGLAWHPQSPEGYSLYIFSQDGPELQQVSKLNPATGAILYVTDLPGVPGEQAGGATISSDLDPDRWCLVTLIQGAAGGFDRVDVRSLEAYAPWLEVEPEAQVIPADGTLEATAILDGAAVPPGEYGINLVIEHNAADPEVVIPASLIVQPTGVEEPSEVQLPAAFAVGPVYPNPFNAQTIIPIALPERSQITMTLYNLMGQRVISIYDGIQDAGQAKVRFDLPYLTSGVYFYRVEAKGLERGGKFEDCGKMLLLK